VSGKEEYYVANFAFNWLISYINIVIHMPFPACSIVPQPTTLKQGNKIKSLL
jgi:hypothetical protein